MSLKSILLIPDTHAPYHCVESWKLVLKVIKAVRPHYLVVLGDFADFYKVTMHLKDPRRRLHLVDEVAIANGLLRQVEPYATEKIFVYGNHEDRLSRYLAQNAPELVDFIGLDTYDWLGLREHGWTEVPYKEDIQLGKLYITHDVGRAGINSTRQSARDYMDNMVMGHNHRMDYHVMANAKGIPHVGASFGWLGDVEKVDYRHKMKAKSEWVQGFGWGWLNTKNECVHLNPVPIIQNTCVVDGKLFSL